MSACRGTGAGWGWSPATSSTISPAGWEIPTCRSTRARRSSATWRRRDMAEALGFFTDTTVCIGCKACEVACKEWNQLPAENGGGGALSGDSYDNTRRLDGIHWRHVRFIEQFKGPYDGRRLVMSDVCKHCVQAGCLEVCPTGAIIRTEFDTVVIQSDVCNGCRACIAACPFGVIDINPVSGTAQKCTLCYDRLKVGLEPACSKACPTDSIQFGSIVELRTRAQKRVDQLKSQGVKAELYGADPNGALGGLNSFYLLVAQPSAPFGSAPYSSALTPCDLSWSTRFCARVRSSVMAPNWIESVGHAFEHAGSSPTLSRS